MKGCKTLGRFIHSSPRSREFLFGYLFLLATTQRLRGDQCVIHRPTAYKWHSPIGTESRSESKDCAIKHTHAWVLMGFRTGHPKIRYFAILIILIQSYLRNNLCKKDTMTLLCPLESRKYISHVKGPLPAPGEKSLSLEMGNLGQESCINRHCYFSTHLLSQTQTYLSCQVFTNVLSLCLKAALATSLSLIFL